MTNLLKDQVSNGIRDLSTGRTLNKKIYKINIKKSKSFDLERFAQDESWVENYLQFGKKVQMVWRSFREEWSNIETKT